MRTAFALLGTILTVSSASAQQAEKRRIAVLDFEYGAVMTSVQAVFGTAQNVGKGISDLLIDKLVNDGTYRVIERRVIDKIMKEQNFSNSDRADPNSAAKIGRLLGVDTIVTGDITQFGHDDHKTNIAGALGGWNKYGLGNVGTSKSKAVVNVTARMIDVNTGEILSSATGHGESARSGTNLLGGGGTWGSNGGGGVDMGSSNFQQTIIGEAVSGAVTSLATQIEQKNTAIPHTAVVVNGLVADATGDSMILNVGTRGGVHVGDSLIVSRVTRTIKDPATGKPLRTIEEPVGEVKITSADEGSAVGTFVGAGHPKVGDAVKSH